MRLSTAAVPAAAAVLHRRPAERPELDREQAGLVRPVLEDPTPRRAAAGPRLAGRHRCGRPARAGGCARRSRSSRAGRSRAGGSSPRPRSRRRRGSAPVYPCAAIASRRTIVVLTVVSAMGSSSLTAVSRRGPTRAGYPALQLRDELARRYRRRRARRVGCRSYPPAAVAEESQRGAGQPRADRAAQRAAGRSARRAGAVRVPARGAVHRSLRARHRPAAGRLHGCAALHVPARSS